MTEFSDDVRAAINRWWQYNEFANVTYDDRTENELDTEYHLIHNFKFISKIPNSLSTSIAVSEEKFGICLRWKSKDRCVAGFEMGSMSVASLNPLLDLVSSGRFLIEEPQPLLRWAVSTRAVLNTIDAEFRNLFEPKDWIVTTDAVLPWRRSNLIQTAKWN